MRISIITFILFVFTLSSHAYLKIDTNDLILQPSVTNISVMSITEPLMPNSYLKTGKIVFTEPETELRRFDIMYFVAVPISFYLTLNLLFILNNSFIAQDGGIPGGVYPSIAQAPVQFRYILMNTLLIPLFVAWSDYQYMKQFAPEEKSAHRSAGLDMGINVVSIKF